jgi:cullin 1
LGLDENDSKKTTLEVYRQYFEKPFIAATEVYYKMESEKFLSENSVTEYMKKVTPLGLYNFFTHCPHVHQ